MNRIRLAVIIAASLLLASPLHAASAPADSPQALYLQAGKEERSGSLTKARELYESIIDRFPESDFAVKANDRLLTIAAPPKQKQDKSEKATPLSLLAPPAAKPLPADPLLRRGVELARMKKKAETMRRHEIERERELFFAREGHRINRNVLSKNEAAWQEGADNKIVEEFGMTLEEMGNRLGKLCDEAKVKGECGEEGFYLLSSP
jgi:hypothetical protein